MKIFKAITGLQYKCPDTCCLFCKECARRCTINQLIEYFEDKGSD